ncbi:MAG: uroporphyrinogen-III C-methyltransferase [Xanthobacteraceae bacterium]|nr:uroporphyrinogen-III C-methyltransferase [Xanthobacteraceae bacterium]
MAALARLPVFFVLTDKRVVVAGGSAAAAWKAELLSAAGAQVDVYAAAPGEELLALACDPPGGAIRIVRRNWVADDFADAALAVGACDDDASAAGFAAAARNAGVPVNVIDKPGFCDFSFGSIVNRSPLVVGISTDGAAPVFAQAIRAKIEALLPQGFSRWVAAAVQWRPAVKSSGLTFAGRRKFWQLFTARAVADPHRAPTEADVGALVVEAKRLGEAVDNGSVTLVGAGPGDPELLTLRAVRALQSADDILFDQQVSSVVLDFARREARKTAVAGTDTHALMIDLAKAGRRVVRLKAGILISANASSDIAACRAAGIAVESVGLSG